MTAAATPPQGPTPQEPRPSGGRSAADAWQEWTQAGRPSDAAVAGAAAVGAAAVVAAAHDGDGLADGTLVDDVLDGDDGMTDEERDELNDKIVADGAAYAATQMQWDTFNNLDWS